MKWLKKRAVVLALLIAVGLGLGVMALAIAELGGVLSTLAAGAVLYLTPAVMLNLIAFARKRPAAFKDALAAGMAPALGFAIGMVVLLLDGSDNPSWVPTAIIAVMLSVVGIPAALLAATATAVRHR